MADYKRDRGGSGTEDKKVAEVEGVVVISPIILVLTVSALVVLAKIQ